jgi:DNA-binding winged helix-turn-helix (wHTH) protein
MVYRFREFTLDDGTRQLLLNGSQVHLTPKAFDLLSLLLVNRPRALSKAELQERLWPSTFVEETNLASLVAEIRRALCDAAANPTFVGTVYGFGYRFVGEVRVGADAPATERSHARLWLTIERRQLPLMEGTNVMGRALDAAIRIDSPGISRYHARIVVAHGEATLEDLGSKNGTHLNGSRMTAPCHLAEGDEIRLGAIVVTFRIASQPGLTETISERA